MPTPSDDALTGAVTGQPASSRAGVPPADTARFAPGAILAGRYRLIALLGRGGMGEVYRADDLTLDQPIALKFLPASVTDGDWRLSQFHSELRVARQVSHKKVCRLYDLGEADGRRFLTMEYVNGEDLSALLRRIGRDPQDKAVEIARQLCAGVAAAHDRGVVHRDLKPANVMLDGEGNVRITDFGIATAAADQSRELMGTLPASEQAGTTNTMLVYLFPIATGVLLMLVVFRSGLLAFAVAWCVWHVTTTIPMRADWSHWSAAPGNWTLAALVALVLFGFYAARAGQPLFGSLLNEQRS